MTILFTEQEKEWIDKKKFKWTIKKGCPEKVRKGLNKKLELIRQ